MKHGKSVEKVQHTGKAEYFATMSFDIYVTEENTAYAILNAILASGIESHNGVFKIVKQTETNIGFKVVKEEDQHIEFIKGGRHFFIE